MDADQQVQDLQIKYKRLAEASQHVWHWATEEHAHVRLTENGHDPDCWICEWSDRCYERLQEAEQEVIPEPLTIMEYRRDHWPLVKDHPDDCSCTPCREYIAMTEK